MEENSWLDRMALKILSKRVMWIFFAAFNIFTIVYIEVQEHSAHPFDVFPFQFLNLVLAIFSADMAIVIVLAQIIASGKTDWVAEHTAQLADKTKQNTDLLALGMENTVAVMRSLESMGNLEEERDAILHARVRALEEMVKELLEKEGDN
jgi:uncharacterized membrane protein